MDEGHKRILTERLGLLQETIRLIGGLPGDLVSYKVVSTDEMELIKTAKDEKGKVYALYEHLLRRPDAFPAFLACLNQNNYHHLTEILEDDESELNEDLQTLDLRTKEYIDEKCSNLKLEFRESLCKKLILKFVYVEEKHRRKKFEKQVEELKSRLRSQQIELKEKICHLTQRNKDLRKELELSEKRLKSQFQSESQAMADEGLAIFREAASQMGNVPVEKLEEGIEKVECAIKGFEKTVQDNCEKMKEIDKRIVEMKQKLGLPSSNNGDDPKEALDEILKAVDRKEEDHETTLEDMQMLKEEREELEKENQNLEEKIQSYELEIIYQKGGKEKLMKEAIAKRKGSATRAQDKRENVKKSGFCVVCRKDVRPGESTECRCHSAPYVKGWLGNVAEPAFRGPKVNKPSRTTPGASRRLTKSVSDTPLQMWLCCRNQNEAAEGCQVRESHMFAD